MKALIFKTDNSCAALAQRLALGIVLFPHGAQKVFGWFGGYGFSGTLNFFTDTMHLPWIIALLVILIEFFGALGLILGLATRIWALGMIAVTLGIVLTSHLQHGFFMNWYGAQKGEGIEYFILMLGLAVSLTLSGGGKASIDGLILKR